MDVKIILTGGAGFIGSQLAKRLLQEKNELLIIDCLHNYYSPDRKKQQLESIHKYGDFAFHEINLLDKQATAKVFRDFSPEAVIHLAALPGVSYSLLKPLEYVDYDIKATINVLEAAGESQVKQMVFASSSSVYGDRQGISLREELADGRVISPYAASKYGAESFCHVYGHLYSYKIKILRFFTVYGPWGRPDMAIANFIDKLLRKEEITIFGSGGTRDYTYIDDIVNGIFLAMTNYQESNVFNIGSGKPIPMEQLLNELRRFFPEMKIKRLKARQGDVSETWADIEKAKRLLGYTPSVDFRTGLSRTIEWAKQHAPF
jgi:UDP-glucuronate 4-epimerase